MAIAMDPRSVTMALAPESEGQHCLVMVYTPTWQKVTYCDPIPIRELEGEGCMNLEKPRKSKKNITVTWI